MSRRSTALRNEVMALSVEDRAELAVELLASLDDQVSEADPTEVDRAWGAEMARRSQQVESGEVTTLTWDEVLAQVAEHRGAR